MMAFYGSKFNEDDTGEYHWTPYGSCFYDVQYEASATDSGFEFNDPKFIEYDTTSYDGVYDPFVTQSEINYSAYNFSEPKFIEYDTTSYGGAYDPFVTRSEINYSAYNFSEPKFIEYAPSPYKSGYFSSETKYIVSYSTSEFNEPDFEEYDPTPYGGGYDLALTYGKPLPPSDEICYPRSTPVSNGPSLDGFSYGSIPSPYGKDDIGEYSTKPRNGSKPSGVKEEGQQRSNGVDGDSLDTGNIGKTLESEEGEERGGHIYGDDYPWTGYNKWYGNGRSGGYGYESGKQVPQTPYGYGQYGSYCVDLCESIFGHWPCLYRKDQINNAYQQVGDEENNSNPWKNTADYLFGNPFAYGEHRDGGGYRGDSIYGCENYYQPPP